MEFLIVDDEIPALENLKEIVERAEPRANIHTFSDWREAVKSAKEIDYDVAFLDIEMPERNGLSLAKDLKDIMPGTNIVFVTGYSDYAVEAFSINASGYILKPAQIEQVQNALNNLRPPIKYDNEKLRVQCFGNFEIFSGDERIVFKRQMAKDLFAYLVNLRGASANTNEICAVLFEEDSEANKHYFRNIVSELRTTLRKYRAKDVFVSSRNSFSIDTSKIECDYYKYLEYDVAAINSYNGEFMSQYSWAEMTNGLLHRDLK